MSQQPKLPDEAQFNAFAGKLRDFRGTLPKEEQHMFDAMVHSAFKQEGQESQDVQGYWYVYGAYPGWYNAPVYYGTPWAYSYGYGYPYY